MSAPFSDPAPVPAGFAALALSPEVLQALADVGYESPSPIQAATIPPLLEGRDVLGQAQTGTGKTAAFALPILSRIELKPGKPQALVLAPTRELAIQVAEAFQRYAAHLPGLQVLPIYGGQSYGPQLHALRRGVHVVVGTPGRVIDHLERGTLDLSGLKFVVLDEADEMLRMGFVDDVEKVLEATPATRQVALFSATMPAPIRKIAQRHLKEPVEVSIKAATTTAANIRQRYWWVSGLHKLDAMTRILEAEPFDAMIVFARTKQATEELAEKLSARGFAAAAINGDMAQPQRERVIQQLKDGKLDILVATDVAARGLDVERISHVLNYDIPYDTESYVHRIGRTGRAGRSGEAILFVTPREKGMLRAIERATRQPIEEMKLPTVEAVNDQRIARFKQRISDTLAVGGLELFQQLIEQYEQEHDVPAIEIAAALARIAQGEQPLLLTPPPRRDPAPREHDGEAHGRRERKPREHAAREQPREFAPRAFRPHATEPGKKTYRIEVGHEHGVKPGNIIGAIANEAGLESRYIGRLSIRGDYSLVDLPEGMPKEIFEHLRKVWVSQQQLRIREWDGGDDGGSAPPTRKPGGFKRPGGKKGPPRKR
ncbi:DEAD/DEAH box helicase [Fulvimonas soli]|jgi:ATP-dependent RNA helicase DeaD|uniref:ATP-dependent RNA helicase DeaD n=1 Tax=Fulvimonas soli TaxID=155197 RepID=A0A316IK77_9GAMM|nr:DEAD/DEAH box helicase [Fulvimonas soli]PWK87612.1 ATP-dependent RNA helicase CsdA [Fulvimonas soli]TNY25798.1 ATP-dependent RNA helicase [Fulvimonas soli]